MTRIGPELDAAADACAAALTAAGARLADVPHWPHGLNVVGRSPHGRAHVERMSAGALEVLHVTVLPAPGTARPIFGADVVGNARMASLAIWDWSPTVPSSPVPTRLAPQCGPSRRLPEWADRILSRHAAAIGPDGVGGLVTFLHHVRASLSDWLALPAGEGDPMPALRRYVMAQRENPRLWSALRAHHEEGEARAYVHGVLWPDPDRLWPEAVAA